MDYNEILSRFTVKKKADGRAQCICPAHNDKEASLTISRGNGGRVVMHCHAGCETSAILAAVGLQMKDLFPDEPWREYVERKEGLSIDGVYRYHNIEDGREEFVRLRLSGKKFIYGTLDGDRFSYGLNGRNRKDIPAVFGDLEKIRAADTVYYCEGEKDVLTVNRVGLVGVTCGGSSDWTPGTAKLFSGKNVVILQDNDQAGEKLTAAVKASLQGIAKNIKVIVPFPGAEHGDVSDYFAQGGTVEELTGHKTRIDCVSAADLLAMDIPPVEFYVPDLVIKTGLTGLVAKPKIGKSWLALDLAISVASGGVFLDKQCEKAPVLYLSLEDSYNRLQDRLKKVLGNKPVPPGLSFGIKCKNLDEGLIQDLQTVKAKLIIIDTLQKIRGQQKRTETLYAYDSREMATLKEFADRAGKSVVIVHHTRKGEDTTDPFQDVSGSNGIFGILDSCLIVTKEKRADKQAKLWTIGRDIDMETYEISFSGSRWNMIGMAEYVEEQKRREAFDQNPIVRTVEKLIGSSGSWEGTSTELMQAGRFVVGRSLAANEATLGRRITELEEDLHRYAAITHDVIRKKGGARVHRFQSENPFLGGGQGDAEESTGTIRPVRADADKLRNQQRCGIGETDVQ